MDAADPSGPREFNPDALEAWRAWTISLTDPNRATTGMLARDAFAAGWDAALATTPPAPVTSPPDALRAFVKAEEWRLVNHPLCGWHQYGPDDEDGPGESGKCIPAMQVIRSLNLILATTTPQAPAPLDVDRLARALARVRDIPDDGDRIASLAELIAHEYAALAPEPR